MSSARKTRQPDRKLGRSVLDYRIEIALGLIVFMATTIASSIPTWLFALIAIPTLALLVWKREVFADVVHGLLYGAKIRRQLKRAARDSGFGDLHIDKIVMTLPGEWVKVHVPRGKTVDALERSAHAIAGCLRVSDVRVIADRDDRSRASISIIRRDPFESIGDYSWPLREASETSVREHMPIGFDEYGRVVCARLLSRNLIVGGAPDSGKSSFLRMPAAYAALDPKARLWMMDGKSAEFEAWKTVAHAHVSGPDLKGAVELLTKLRDEMEARYRELTAMGEVFIQDHMNVDVLMIDEVPTYTRATVMSDKKAMEQIKTIQGLLWTIIARGRAAGVITIISAQKPDANTIPTDIRDLVDNKFALHCNTKAMSDTILGAGAGEEAVANAATIPSGQPGVGYYLGDEGVVKMKAFYLSHQQAIEISSRVAAARLDDELSTLTA